MGDDKTQAIKAWLRSGEEFLVVSHVNPDGDAVGSLLAVSHILNILGKKGVLVNQDRLPNRFSYLTGFEHVLHYSDNGMDRTFQKVICVDCADRDRVGMVKSWFAHDAEILNIDHHPTNDAYGAINLINPIASSTCEVIYDWVRDAGIQVTEPLAQALYTGYLTDTGGFRYSNTTPKVLRDASELVELGAHPYLTAERALESITYAYVKLLTRALSTMELAFEGNVAFLKLPISIYQETGAKYEDAEGIVNYGINIEGVQVAVLLKETEEGVKVSLRSKAGIDVSQIAKEFGGGGHTRAAGFFLKCDIDTALDRIKMRCKQLF